ncbi:MAG: J domain-containing protein [Pseudomonadota bacterium]
MQDPYRVLNVSRRAGQAAIKAAYRELAKRWHPDRNPGNTQAEQRFKQVTQAYELLRDPAKRAQFDRGQIDSDGKPQFGFGHGGFGGGPEGTRHAGVYGGEGLFEKIFGGAFGARGQNGRASFDDLAGAARAGTRSAGVRGNDHRYRVEVDFLLAARGGKQRLELVDRAIEIDIPAGTEDGRVLRLKGQGGRGSKGTPSGDALVTIAVLPHDRFSLKGKDVHLDLPVSLQEALLGAKVMVPTISGPVRIGIPEGSNTGRTLRLKGKGIAVAGQPSGDQYVRLLVTLPEHPDSELISFVRHWAEKNGYDPRSDSDNS